MIGQTVKINVIKGESFRLLNSEIGNDHKYVTGINDNYVLSFRLLNSEIGNDPTFKLIFNPNGRKFSSP